MRNLAGVGDESGTSGTGAYDFVVVANRLPVDRHVDPDGAVTWRTSPGGLVTAMEPVMRSAEGAWVGWTGDTDEGLDAEEGAGTRDAESATPEPFDQAGIHLVPVPLSAGDVEEFYEGFSNATLWPLYHDVIATPRFHREWWDRYVRVNERFTRATLAQAARGATVWVQDYQLQLVPQMLRRERPDLRIGFFDHIPFPPWEIFSQLPWRSQVLDGLLGADLVGFQRMSDANNFLRACRHAKGLVSRRQELAVDDGDDGDGRTGGARRTVRATAFPISVDSPALDEAARTDGVAARVQEIRFELGAPRRLLLGVDRLDYTKGITHRLKAYGELLADGAVDPEETVLVQVATPSRERVASYMALRDEIEQTVGRINGDHGTIGRPAVHYLHSSQPREEMTALFRAADVMLVTALRDGMNLVAKEYVAARFDERGVLVLSEFTGAADELGRALMVNPHDINQLKEQILRALSMGDKEQGRRMRSLRRRVMEHDVTRWARDFLGALEALTRREDHSLGTALEGLAGRDAVLVALDFDGVLAPIIEDPSSARPLPAARAAIERLVAAPGVRVALVSGRSLEDLRAVAQPPEGAVLVASHGAEVEGVPTDLDDAARELLEDLVDDVEAVVAEHEGTATERKPAGVVLHTRRAEPEVAERAQRAVHEGAGAREGVHVLAGKAVVELSVVSATKGEALAALRGRLEVDAVLYAGDDVTDESALATLDGPAGDVGIKVGDGETCAEHRLDDPEAVAGALARLADLREARA